MRDRGVLVSTDGPFHNVLKIKPPLCFTARDADLLARRSTTWTATASRAERIGSRRSPGEAVRPTQLPTRLARRLKPVRRADSSLRRHSSGRLRLIGRPRRLPGVAWPMPGGACAPRPGLLRPRAAGSRRRRRSRCAAPTDLDAFMAQVLERRNENWQTLHDYILSERETFQVLGPGGIPLAGQRREFQWFIRDGFLVRSPVKANGASLGAARSAKYEARLAEEGAGRGSSGPGEGGQQKDEAAGGSGSGRGGGSTSWSRNSGRSTPRSDKEVVALVGTEPRFISEAYFMKFPFEPGNYYLAGRETIDGRDGGEGRVLPDEAVHRRRGAAGRRSVTRSAAASGDVKVDSADRREPRRQGGQARSPPGEARQGRRDRGRNRDARMNKVTMVTMWIDPAGVPDRPLHLRQRRLGLPAGPRHRPRRRGEGRR
ncbi:MAG: hypothetical protein MZW92_20245 [Comamonadaceae bacterium]|nr:hypothetical protein [Comamonadaceae bacterium]